MRSTLKSGGGTTTPSVPFVVVLGDRSRAMEVVRLLDGPNYRVSTFETTPETDDALRHNLPAAVIGLDAPEESARRDLAARRASARASGVPVLQVVEAGLDPETLLARTAGADDWVSRGALEAELPARLARLVRGGVREASPARSAPVVPTDSGFFPLIVHDLRTPLNVIGLSLRMIDQALPKGNAELEEDLRFVEENFKQIERMLSQLSDYCRLFEVSTPGPPTEFSPQRFLSEVVQERVAKAGPKAGPVRLEVEGSSPLEASLDAGRARLAIQYALGNAINAANGAGVRVTLRGGPDRLVTELGVDQPPPPSVKSVVLHSHLFERLCGSAAERRGMDLAIAARVTELFGGVARLEVEGNRGTRIVLDWPARFVPAG